MEDEVADGVCALDRVGVFIECIQEPVVFLLYEVSRAFIGPELDSALVRYLSGMTGDLIQCT